MSLAERLKSSRKKLGLSQTALAEIVDVSQPTIANWERGGHVPRQDALQRIAEALKTDPAWLLSGELPADLNPAHQHLAKPLYHIPVFDWPLDATDPTLGQPARYMTVAMDATGVFGLLAGKSTNFPSGTLLIFQRHAKSVPGQFLLLRGGKFTLEECSAVDNVFARLIYSVVPH